MKGVRTLFGGLIETGICYTSISSKQSKISHSVLIKGEELKAVRRWIFT